MSTTFKTEVSLTDASFGTFFVYGDPAMAIFLIFLIIFLLWDKNAYQVMKYRKIVILWFTASVFFANAVVCQAILLLVYGVYLLQTLKKPLYFYLSIVGMIPIIIILALVLLFAPVDITIPHLLVALYKGGGRLLLSGEVSDLQMKIFLSGGYSREAALYYLFVVKGLMLFGEGPGTFYGIFQTMGHFFTFYAETGLLGLLSSYLAMYFMSSKIRRAGKQYANILFVSVLLLTLTTDVFIHCTIIFIYVILCKSYILSISPLIPKTVRPAKATNS
ncbi:hypothetical protein [Tunicatimonas pelagia]|uniref:hypothetical protein n=1 Tax=Tunicatimonas pelagia TaxID=931531 RepID=UPI00266641A4|nr:hypothetical protein [Tunicatimonas pelagia]WKN40705.1 hypothetical protein P0M28_16830 [Tunicatimonas pelagia]